MVMELREELEGWSGDEIDQNTLYNCIKFSKSKLKKKQLLSPTDNATASEDSDG